MRFSAKISLCQSVFVGIIAIFLFFIGGIFFIRFASFKGEHLSVEGQVATVGRDSQWIPVLFGSYLVPLIGLMLDSAINYYFFIFLSTIILLVIMIGNDVPPAVFLLFAGFRFYNISLRNGLSDLRFISKKKVINDPSEIKVVIRLFKNDSWFLDGSEKNV